MQTPPLVNFEEHPFLTRFASDKRAAQESPPESSARLDNGLPDHRGDVDVPKTKNCSFLEPQRHKIQLKTSFVCVSQNNDELAKTLCFQEQMTVIAEEARLHSSPVASTPLQEEDQKLLDLPCIVKYKLSSITFSGSDSHAFANESSEDGASSLEEEDGHDGGDGDDDDDDDVFAELPQSGDLVFSHRSKDKQEVRGGMSDSPQVTSPWSDSMNQLMKKLDQLNLDIEEALSSSSSPSNTRAPPARNSGEQFQSLHSTKP
ncbi:hypothetical protein Q5P01_009741 [Channa striata]|uniref:Uncharacterized protein n=1 Tax=Channa striata TaxID=64152 RepID=A0AA88MYD6_CHASR|nr:hypothetical protein Q5P01_009741 [Channa striata]